MTAHELHERDGRLVARFAGACPQCGTDQVVEFALPAEPTVGFGGAEPSTLLDPGQFLWASDQAAARVPVNVSTLDASATAAAMQDLRHAIAALQEVGKFIPVHGDGVPAAQLRSELGHALYSAEPNRFTASEVTARIASYQDALAELNSAAASRG